jgi:hypothetical protein
MSTGFSSAAIPNAPTIGTATATSDVAATVTYTAAVLGATGTTFTATSNPSSITGTGSSPITVTGLTASTSYTFTVTAGNANGTSAASSASNSITTSATPSSYESIATVTVGSGGQANIEFTSIPQTYKHLQIRGILKSNRTGSTGGGWAWIRINGNLGARYHSLYATSAVGSYAGVPAQDVGYILAATGSASGANNMFGPCVIDILDYTNTNKNKVLRILSGSETNDSDSLVQLSSYLVNSTSAITSITIGGADSTNLLQYSSLALYGIKGA